jgi:hypothetical protein
MACETPGNFHGLAVDVFIGRARVSVSEGLCDGLAARLEAFGAPDAASRLRERHAVVQSDKPVVREVLGRWRQSVGTAPVSEELYDLQVEMGKGLAPDRG